MYLPFRNIKIHDIMRNVTLLKNNDIVFFFSPLLIKNVSTEKKNENESRTKCNYNGKQFEKR